MKRWSSPVQAWGRPEPISALGRVRLPYLLRCMSLSHPAGLAHGFTPSHQYRISNRGISNLFLYRFVDAIGAYVP